jgi:hypothetical protein
MKHIGVFFFTICFIMVLIAGCTIPVPQMHDHANESAVSPETTVLPPVGPGKNHNDAAASEDYPKEYNGTPLLLTESDWRLAHDCGWDKEKLADTTNLLLGNCQVRHLIRDGGTIAGIRYDMNLIGSRCRQPAHPGASDSCDWCLDAGPVLVINYPGMKVEYLAHLNEQTVSHFSTDLPEGSGSAYNGKYDVILFRNGTIFYTFDVDEEHTFCSQ